METTTHPEPQSTATTPLDPARRAVVVGIDGSAHSFHAVMWAAAEATTRDVPLRLVHVWNVPTTVVTAAPVPTAFVDPAVFDAEAHHVVADVVDSLRARLGQDCPEIETVVRAGDPVGVLSEEAASAGLLVVGSHGRHAIAHALLGSVAEACLRHSSCPVVVVRIGRTAADDAPVVVGVDESDAARAALEWAVVEAGRLGRRLVVVHADAEGTGTARRFLDHLLTSVAVVRRRPRSTSWHVLHRDAADALIDAASIAALLVLGAPHHGLRERIVGSTTSRCVREATCPVVLVPSGAVPEVTLEATTEPALAHAS